MSSATDELRRLLDERGVEWDYGITGATSTRFSADGIDVTFVPMRYGLICSTILTPEQAVEVTLGREECIMRLAFEEEDADGCIWPDHYECSACGAKVHGILPCCDTEIPPRFCPNCGRKVKQ